MRRARAIAAAILLCLAASDAGAQPREDPGAALEQALAAAERSHGATSPDLLPIMGLLAQQRFDSADIAAALALRRRSLKIAGAAFGYDSAAAAEAMTALASLYIELQRYLDAEPLLIAAGNALGERLGAEDPTMAPVLTGRSAIALARGDKDGALEWARQAVAIAEKNELRQQGGPLRALGAALAAADRFDESEATLQRALAHDRGSEGEDGLATARSLAQLGHVYLRQKRFAAALPLIEDAARIDQEQLGTGHPRIAGDFYGIGIAHLESGRAVAAAKALRYAIELTDRSPERDGPSAAYLRLALARAEHEEGRDDEAKILFVEAQRILAAALDDEHQRERLT